MLPIVSTEVTGSWISVCLASDPPEATLKPCEALGLGLLIGSGEVGSSSSLRTSSTGDVQL